MSGAAPEMAPDPRRALASMESAQRALEEGRAALRSLDENERAQAERAYETATRSARKRLDESIARIEEEYRERSASFEARAKSERGAIERAYRTNMEMLQEKSSGAIQKLRDQLKEELWLISTVSDADERQAKATHDRVIESVLSMREKLATAKEESAEHWKFYAYDPPKVAPDDAAASEATVRAAEEATDAAGRAVAALGGLRSPQFAQRWALITLAVALGVGGLVGGLALSAWEMKAIAYVGGVVGALLGVGMWMLIGVVARKGIESRSAEVVRAMASARRLVGEVETDAGKAFGEAQQRIKDKREREIITIRNAASEREGKLVASREKQSSSLKQEFAGATAALDARLTKEREKFE